MSESCTSDQVRSGDVLAFRGHGFWSTLIRYRTLSSVTHVGFALWLQGELVVAEAREGRGVRLYPLRVYLQDPDLQIDWYELLTVRYKIDRARVVESALGHWGKRYASAWQFLRSYGLITRRMADRLGMASDTNPERFYCSEFVLSCLRDAGYRNGEGVLPAPAEASPGDICRLNCLHRRGRIRR